MLLVLLVLAATTAVGLAWRARDGRFTATRHRPSTPRGGARPRGHARPEGHARPVGHATPVGDAAAGRRAAADGTAASGRHTTADGHAAPGPADADVAPPGGSLTAQDLGRALGTSATFVQLSSEVCTPCRRTAGVLADVAARTPGVVHVELDAAERLDLVRRFHVLRTPTVLLLDAHGRLRARTSGAVSPRQALAVLGTLVRVDGPADPEPAAPRTRSDLHVPEASASSAVAAPPTRP